MMETTKEIADRVILNDLTWPRVVMIKFLTSLFKNSPDFEWDEDLRKTSIAVISNNSNFDELNEGADRVIVMRQSFNGQNLAVDFKTSVNRDMYTHKIVKPKLGYLNIFCESRNDVQAEYIATVIENVLMLHKEVLMEKNLLIGNNVQLSDISKPISGTGFFSLMLSVPTHVSGTVDFSIDKPNMVSSIEIDWALKI